VLDSVPGEHPDRAVIHLHREVNGQLALRLAEDSPQALVEAEPIGCDVELVLGDLPGVNPAGVLGCH
jgi:hypothetical protein